ncbi:hypothetical protein POVWA2_075750 [Plasmodium ovale wallikeri]|uniref:Uncharacterized protein n=1 Tax=Plasmodium ovale wallikeri TaxID=864142 RepID=A0A1A9AJR7_PLAOA|nr:hypothetical protein POVWA2_075750 [Plasmodium ovale wallikeri]
MVIPLPHFQRLRTPLQSHIPSHANAYMDLIATWKVCPFAEFHLTGRTFMKYSKYANRHNNMDKAKTMDTISFWSEIQGDSVRSRCHLNLCDTKETFHRLSKMCDMCPVQIQANCALFNNTTSNWEEKKKKKNNLERLEISHS